MAEKLIEMFAPLIQRYVDSAMTKPIVWDTILGDLLRHMDDEVIKALDSAVAWQMQRRGLRP